MLLLFLYCFNLKNSKTEIQLFYEIIFQNTAGERKDRSQRERGQAVNIEGEKEQRAEDGERNKKEGWRSKGRDTRI